MLKKHDISHIINFFEDVHAAQPLNQALSHDTILTDPNDPTSIVLSPEMIHPWKVGKEVHMVWGPTHFKSTPNMTYPRNIAKFSMVGKIRSEGRNMDILGPKPPREGSIPPWKLGSLVDRMCLDAPHPLFSDQHQEAHTYMGAIDDSIAGIDDGAQPFKQSVTGNPTMVPEMCTMVLFPPNLVVPTNGMIMQSPPRKPTDDEYDIDNPGPPGTLYPASPTEFPGYRDGMVASARLRILQRPFFDGDRPIHPGHYEKVLLEGDIVRWVVSFGALLLDTGLYGFTKVHELQKLDVDWENFGDAEADVPVAEDHSEENREPSGLLDKTITSDVFGEVIATGDGDVEPVASTSVEPVASTSKGRKRGANSQGSGSASKKHKGN